MKSVVSNPLQAARAAAALRLGILENQVDENFIYEERFFDSEVNLPAKYRTCDVPASFQSVLVPRPANEV